MIKNNRRMIKNNRKFAEMNAGKVYEYRRRKYRVVGYSNYYPDHVIVANSMGWDRSHLREDDIILVNGSYRKFYYLHILELEALEK